MKTKLTKTIRNATFCLLLTSSAVFAADNWKEKLQKELPLLGHRNWIVVADSAYPLQTAPGIETICADADQVTVVREVLAALAKTRHVQPELFTDAEMKFVAEKNAPGIGAYRESLAKILANQKTQVLPHEQIISKLDEAGKTFKVLIIKTPLTLPYTAVFFQLECGYWNAASEQELRAAMQSAGQ
jgi:D-ribose pyranose/furanose isomerase RbsD